MVSTLELAGLSYCKRLELKQIEEKTVVFL